VQALWVLPTGENILHTAALHGFQALARFPASTTKSSSHQGKYGRYSLSFRFHVMSPFFYLLFVLYLLYIVETPDGRANSALGVQNSALGMHSAHWECNSTMEVHTLHRECAMGVQNFALHCNGNSVYIFLFWELCGLSPNFHIHVSVGDLYIPRIGPHIYSSRKGRPIVGIYNSLTDT
jgi:hypothetical protein